MGIITVTDPNYKIPADLPIDYTRHPVSYANLLKFSTDVDTPIHRAVVEYIATNITVQKAASANVQPIPPRIPEFTSQAESKVAEQDEPADDVVPQFLDDLYSLPSLDFSRTSEVSEITMPVITVSDSSDESTKSTGSDVVFLSASASICSIDLRKDQLKKAIPTSDIQLAAMKFQIGDLSHAYDTELRDALMLDLAVQQGEFETLVESNSIKTMEIFDAARYIDAVHAWVIRTESSTLIADVVTPTTHFVTTDIIEVVNDTVEKFIHFHASSREEFRSIGRLKKLYDDFCGKSDGQKLPHTEKALSAKLASRTKSIIAQADAIRTMAHRNLRQIRDIWDASTQKAYDEAMEMKAFVHASLAELD